MAQELSGHVVATELEMLAAFAQDPSLPFALPLGDSVGPLSAGGTIRFTEPPTDDLLAYVETKTGVQFNEVGGHVVRIGTVVSAEIPYAALPQLAELDDIVRVEAAWRPFELTPMRETRTEVQADLANAMPNALDGITGQGVVIADLDGAFDVFHPALFQADGVLRPFIDVDGDGEFSDGDAVDWNEDGVVDDDEICGVLDATHVTYTGEQSNADGRFDPGVDWIFMDWDGNGERDYGPDAGFTEADETYGEPLFVGDDANGDGVLNVGERVVQLTQSKVIGYFRGDEVRMRGTDLIHAWPEDFLVLQSGQVDDLTHGTGVLGILAGGFAIGASDAGIAPEAELLLVNPADYAEGDTRVDGMFWAQQNGADIMLHEYTTWVGEFLDGSSNVEAAMDALRAEGMVQVNPAGNLGDSGKHAVFAVDGTTSIDFVVPSDSGYEMVGLYATLLWDINATGDVAPILTLVSPNGERTDIATAGFDPVLVEADHYAFAGYDVSDRGTGRVDVYVYDESGRAELPAGVWSVEWDHGTASFDLHAFVTDAYSGWGRGIGFESEDPSGTICWPATADSAITVAAYGGTQDMWWDGADGSVVGELRHYSSRGPLVSGGQGINIAAPDDPMSLIPELNGRTGHGWYSRFGGTSGAGPHVAGVLALLIQAHPEWTVSQLEDALFDGASEPPTADVLPSAEWGWGRLRALGALGRDDALNNSAPDLVFDLVAGVDFVQIDMGQSTDADGDVLTFACDIDYDGMVDFEHSETPAQHVTLPDGDYVARLRVADGRGGTDGAVVAFSIPGSDVLPGEDVGVDADNQPDAGVDTGFDVDDGGDTGAEGCAYVGTHGAKRGASWAGLVGLLGLGFRRRTFRRDVGVS